MTRPDKMTDPSDHVERAAVKHEARLEAAEDRLERAARKADALGHGPGAEDKHPPA